MGAYEKFFRPLIFKMDAEDAHHLAIAIGKTPGFAILAATIKGCFCYDDDLLKTKIGNAVVRNPVGLAAGFDKNGYLVKALASLGFGFDSTPYDLILMALVTIFTLLSVSFYLVEWARHMSTIEAN